MATTITVKELMKDAKIVKIVISRNTAGNIYLKDMQGNKIKGCKALGYGYDKQSAALAVFINEAVKVLNVKADYKSYTGGCPISLSFGIGLGAVYRAVRSIGGEIEEIANLKDNIVIYVDFSKCEIKGV